MRMLAPNLLLVVALFVPLRAAEAQARPSRSLRPTAEQLAATAQLYPPARPAADQTSLLVAAPYQRGTPRQGVVLMIVGVAGMITGLIIEEPAVTILSAVVGGVGLYLYLR
jgi:hypothetical protein